MEKQFLLSKEIQDFLDFCASKGFAEKTISSHRKHLSEFHDWIDRNSELTVDEVDRQDVTNFIRPLARNGKSASDIDAYKRSIRAFYAWVSKKPGIYINNPSKGRFLPRTERQIKPGIKATDVEAIVKSCGDDFIGRRDRAIIIILSETGIRSSELCKLQISDFDRKKAIIQVRSGKGIQSRCLRVSSSAIYWISLYLSMRKPIDMSEWLFVAKSNMKLSSKDISAILRRRSKGYNYRNGILPSDLRRTYGMKLLFETHDMAIVAQQMGYCAIPDITYFTGQLPDTIPTTSYVDLLLGKNE